MASVSILRTVNNILNLPEIYYYAFYVWALWNCRAGIQTRAFVNRSYGINSNSLQSFITPTHFGDPLLSTGRCPSSDATVFYRDCYHDGPGLSVLMMCAESGQQFRSEALLVQEQISNIMEWVGMCSPGKGRGWGGRGCRTRLPFVTCCWLLWRQMIILGSMIELMGRRNRWGRKEKWVVSDKPSLCVWL